jgi:hypothetical protein
VLADPLPPHGPRDLSTVLWRRGRLSLILEPRDLWVGAYAGHGAVYVILVPCFPLRWQWRAPEAPAPLKMTPEDFGRPSGWMPGDWGGPA